MAINDIIGSIGVTMMLVAFLLNIVDKLNNDHIFYILLNFLGGVMACIASYLINYTPFIILEATWTLISAWGIYDWFIRKQEKNNG